MDQCAFRRHWPVTQFVLEALRNELNAGLAVDQGGDDFRSLFGIRRRVSQQMADAAPKDEDEAEQGDAFWNASQMPEPPSSGPGRRLWPAPHSVRAGSASSRACFAEIAHDARMTERPEFDYRGLPLGGSPPPS